MYTYNVQTDVLFDFIFQISQQSSTTRPFAWRVSCRSPQRPARCQGARHDGVNHYCIVITVICIAIGYPTRIYNSKCNIQLYIR